MRHGDRLEQRRARVFAFVAGALEPGERIDTVLSWAPIRLRPVGIPVLPWAGPALRLGKQHAVVVTDRRVLFVRLSSWSGKPRTVETAWPRAMVTVVRYQRPRWWFSGYLVLGVAGEVWTTDVAPAHRDEVRQLIDALGMAADVAAGTPPSPNPTS